MNSLCSSDFFISLRDQGALPLWNPLNSPTNPVIGILGAVHLCSKTSASRTRKARFAFQPCRTCAFVFNEPRTAPANPLLKPAELSKNKSVDVGPNGLDLAVIRTESPFTHSSAKANSANQSQAPENKGFQQKF